MADVFFYADETGNLDYGGSGKHGASPYFGFGTAMFAGEHAEENWDAQVLRAHLEERNVRLPKGFHAKNDAWPTRQEVFGMLRLQAPRIDTTFLAKSNAYESVRTRGEVYLYKLAWYLHLKYLCESATTPADRLYVVVASFGTHARATAAREAVDGVCHQMNRDIVLCVWDAGSCWGLQAADYALWAVHRNLVGGKHEGYARDVEPLVQSRFLPWGAAPP